MPETAARIDPFRAFNFEISIGNQVEAQFTRCSSIGVRVQTIAYRSGGTQNLVHKLPGRVEYSNVTLSYGMTQSRVLWEWFKAVADGARPVPRKGVTITLRDQANVTRCRVWNLLDAFPVQWCGSELDAMNGTVAIETLELAFESLDIPDVQGAE